LFSNPRLARIAWMTRGITIVVAIAGTGIVAAPAALAPVAARARE